MASDSVTIKTKSLETPILITYVIALLLSVARAMYVTLFFKYEFIDAWWLGITLVGIALVKVIAKVMHKDSSNVLFGIAGFIAFLDIAYLFIEVSAAFFTSLSKFGSTVVMAWHEFNLTLQITFSGLVSTIQTVAMNQRFLVHTQYGAYWFVFEAILALAISTGTIWYFAVNRRRFSIDRPSTQMSIRWILFVTWFIYAAWRGYSTMLPLFVLTIFVEKYAETIVRFIISISTVVTIDVAERKGNKKTVRWLTAFVIAATILGASATLIWFVGISVLFSANPITTLFIVVAGISIARLFKKKK